MASEHASFQSAITRAILLIPQHPQVRRIGEPKLVNGDIEIDVTFAVNLPFAMQAAGCSPNGVRAEEDVRFHFPSSFPLDAPTPSLRQDFDRSLPHIHPFLRDERPLPCISEISLNSLLHQDGIRGILNQTALWLANAAVDNLIDPSQGWEPTRRDDLPHSITADGDILRSLVTRDYGHHFFALNYAILELQRGGKGLRGVIDPKPIRFHPNNLARNLAFRQFGEEGLGTSPALFVWPGKNPDGTLAVCSQYRPDDVRTFRDLLNRSTDFGLNPVLQDQLEYLRRCARKLTLHRDFSLGIILCVRRPVHLIGSASELELICYVAKFSDLTNQQWHDKPVEPAAHNQQLGPALCRRLSGIGQFDGKWTLIGAGSLGSKIAMHLTRQGMAPAYVIDRGNMRQHNAVRHALLPGSSVLDTAFLGHKAVMLAQATSAFGQQTEPIVSDAVEVLRNSRARNKCISLDTCAIINSAASVRLREALADLSPIELNAPVIETSLFSQGRVAVVTKESNSRSPNTGDLITEFYRIAGSVVPLQRLLFEQESQLERVNIGDGCGSPTMIISDAMLSAHAAAMARMISIDFNSSEGASRGKISIATLFDDDVSLVWSNHVPPRIKCIQGTNLPKWTVHLSDRVESMLDDEVRRWPGVETGGILMGRISEISRTFYVVDVLPAPPDSERSSACFSLGVKGVKSSLGNYSIRHGWTLYCLGTWHSHLGASTPSQTDEQTTRSVSLARVAPSLLLIKAPLGYSALIADAAQLPAKQ